MATPPGALTQLARLGGEGGAGGGGRGGRGGDGGGDTSCWYAGHCRGGETGATGVGRREVSTHSLGRGMHDAATGGSPVAGMACGDRPPEDNELTPRKEA